MTLHIRKNGKFEKGFSDIARVEYYTFYSPDGCWYWTGYTNKKGYGVIKCNGSTLLVHRLNYILHNGPVPDGLLICHHCDNPACINPHHLFIGTVKDNSDDMIKKGRGYVRLGGKNPNAILNETDVVIIREAKANGFKRQAIADYFKVGLHIIDDISYRRSWLHI